MPVLGWVGKKRCSDKYQIACQSREEGREGGREGGTGRGT